MQARTIPKLEIRSVERGICLIATMNGRMHYAWTKQPCFSSALKSDVTMVFLDPDFLQDANISAIWP